jgi:hypothetical protein
MIKHLFFGALGVGLLLTGGRPAKADTYATDFEAFSVGEVHGQDGWTSGHGSSFCPLYDVGVVSNSYGYASFGTKALRISNAITCGSFNDHTFSKSLADEAGETAADTSVYSGGTRQPYFEAQWDFASTVPGSQQVGLAVVASPDRGDPGRMAWLQMQDTPTGLQLNFQDYSHSILNFTVTPVATGLNRAVAHSVKMSVQFADGAGNDIVKIYVDGVLSYTGTTWEDYYRDFETGFPHAVDSMLFRVAGTAAPGNLGNGFLIDNFSSFSGPVPDTSASVSSRTGTITVTKKVVNDDGGTKTVNDFPLFVGGTPVASGVTTSFHVTGGIFSVTETGDPKYVAKFTGDCDANGDMNLLPGENKFCILTNDDVAPTTAVSPPPVPTPPVKISVTKTANHTSLVAPGGSVSYAYDVSNAGTQPLSDISTTDDMCSPMRLLSGDRNADAVLNVGETWKYSCQTNLTETTTNTVSVSGTFNGVVSSSSATATVVVDASVPQSYGSAQAHAEATSIDADKGLSAPTGGTAPHCADGTLMKLADDHNAGTQSDTTIYFCGADGGRYAFPDRGTYLSWYADFSGVQTVSAAALSSVQLKGIVTYRPGSRLLKIESDSKAYAVAKGGVLRWVTTEEVARLLYGPEWNTFVTDIPVTLFGSVYHLGAQTIALTDVLAGSALPPSAQPKCTTTAAFTALLQFGFGGAQVLQLQQLLQCLGYFPETVAPNGNFGPATLAAVKAFQSGSGIDPVGYVGPATRGALNRYVAK